MVTKTKKTSTKKTSKAPSKSGTTRPTFCAHTDCPDGACSKPETIKKSESKRVAAVTVGPAKPEKPAKMVKPAATVALSISSPIKVECSYKGGSHKATLHPNGTMTYNGLTVTPQRAMKLACDMPWSPTLQTAWRGWRVAEGEQKGQAIGDLRKDGLFHSKPKAEKPAPVEKPAKPAKPAKKTKTASGKASA